MSPEPLIGTTVRDSKHPALGMLLFPHPEWTAFLRSIKEDEV